MPPPCVKPLGPFATPWLSRTRTLVRERSESLVIPPPWTVAIPFGALAVAVLLGTTLLLIVAGTEPAKKPTAPAAAASLVGVVIVIRLPTTSTPVIVASESASKALGPLTPFVSEDDGLGIVLDSNILKGARTAGNERWVTTVCLPEGSVD